MRYFAFGGRAAPLRIAAFLGGVAYQDEFITNNKEQKAEGKRRWSGLPEIVVGDQVIGQSNACLRYIGTNAPASLQMSTLCLCFCPQALWAVCTRRHLWRLRWWTK